VPHFCQIIFDDVKLKNDAQRVQKPKEKTGILFFNSTVTSIYNTVDLGFLATVSWGVTIYDK
jgi:hypothetical protein